jgi:hypothetical protein
MPSQLTASDQSTYNAIFQHPVARNLEWLQVRSMLASVADSVQEHGDVLKVTRNGRSLILHRPYRKHMKDIADLMKVRHFLEQIQQADEATSKIPQSRDGDGLS